MLKFIRESYKSALKCFWGSRVVGSVFSFQFSKWCLDESLGQKVVPTIQILPTCHRRIESLLIWGAVLYPLRTWRCDPILDQVQLWVYSCPARACKCKTHKLTFRTTTTSSSMITVHINDGHWTTRFAIQTANAATTSCWSMLPGTIIQVTQPFPPSALPLNHDKTLEIRPHCRCSHSLRFGDIFICYAPCTA